MIFKCNFLSIYSIFIRKICLGLPLLLLGACVQEADAPVGTATQPEKTGPVRTWFEANKEVLISRSQEGSESSRTSYKFLFPYIEKEIDWSQSLTFKFKDGREVVEFPVKSEQIPIPGFLVDSVGDKSKIKIKQSALFVKKQGGSGYSAILVRFYTLGGDLDKVSYNQIPKGWNGIIEAFGMNDGHYITFNFKEGKMVSYSKIGADEAKNSTIRDENKRSNCYTLLVENPSYVLCVESIHDCTIYSGGTTPITYCIPDASFDPADSEAGGDGSGGDGFCEGFDCYSFPGGESGGEEEEEDQIIKDPSFEGTKADCVYEKLVNLSGGFKNAIKKFDGDFPVAHLRFMVDNNLNLNSFKGFVTPPYNYTINIVLNGNPAMDESFQKRPNLLVAKTLIHEVIHAEMWRKILSIIENGGDVDGLSKQQWESKLALGDYPGIFDYYTRFGVNGFQHSQMAAHYRNSIATALQEFDTGIPLGVNEVPDQYYMDLAWEGLIYQNDPTWQSLSSSERIRITSTIDNLISSKINDPCY